MARTKSFKELVQHHVKGDAKFAEALLREGVGRDALEVHAWACRIAAASSTVVRHLSSVGLPVPPARSLKLPAPV